MWNVVSDRFGRLGTNAEKFILPTRWLEVAGFRLLCNSIGVRQFLLYLLGQLLHETPVPLRAKIGSEREEAYPLRRTDETNEPSQYLSHFGTA